MEKNNSKKPLYIQLKELIKEEIESGIYKPGDMIPRELEYQEKYNLSRITVRQAIGTLVDQGFLKRTKGKGTEVLSPKLIEPLLKIKSFTEEMKENGLMHYTKYANIMITKAFGEVSKQLLLPEGEEVYKLRRIRCVKDTPIVLFDTYLLRSLDIDLNNEIYFGSLYEYLERHNDLEIKKVVQRITAATADKELSKLLHCSVGDAILILKRQGFDNNGRLIEYTIGKYVADRYEYYLEIDET
jgi:GntR family transcriptional regulator